MIFSLLKVGEAVRLEKAHLFIGIACYTSLVYTFPFLLRGMFLQLRINASIMNQYYI